MFGWHPRWHPLPPHRHMSSCHQEANNVALRGQGAISGRLPDFMMLSCISARNHLRSISMRDEEGWRRTKDALGHNAQSRLLLEPLKTLPSEFSSEDNFFFLLILLCSFWRQLYCMCRLQFTLQMWLISPMSCCCPAWPQNQDISSLVPLPRARFHPDKQGGQLSVNI